MDTTRTIPAGLAEELSWVKDGEAVFHWTRITEQDEGQSRWENINLLVIRDDRDDTIWGLEYRTGLTEMQETSLPWEGGDGTQPLNLVRLYPHTITRTEYQPEPAEVMPA